MHQSGRWSQRDDHYYLIIFNGGRGVIVFGDDPDLWPHLCAPLDQDECFEWEEENLRDNYRGQMKRELSKCLAVKKKKREITFSIFEACVSTEGGRRVSLFVRTPGKTRLSCKELIAFEILIVFQRSDWNYFLSDWDWKQRLSSKFLVSVSPFVTFFRPQTGLMKWASDLFIVLASSFPGLLKVKFMFVLC